MRIFQKMCFNWSVQMIKINQEVFIKSLGIKGEVVFIDYHYLHHKYMYPVQLKLKEPWYNDGYTVSQPNSKMYRTGIEDLQW